jgi:hypothetical protein
MLPFIKNLLSDYLFYSKYLVHFLSPVFLIYGLSNFLTQTILGHTYYRQEQMILANRANIELLANHYQYLFESSNRHEQMLSFIKEELSKQRDV